jgi:hypothetical protein
VIAPLSKAAEHSPSEVVRLSAVECLGQQPWEDVSAAVKRVASSEIRLFGNMRNALSRLTRVSQTKATSSNASMRDELSFLDDCRP